MKLKLLPLILLFSSCSMEDNKDYKNIKLHETIDSLDNEIFTRDLQIQRYEYIIEESQSALPPDSKKILDSIISHTE